MTATEATIRVLIGGAILHGGWHTLLSPATLKDALTSAGGLSDTKGAPPAGIVSVRRPGGWHLPPGQQESFVFNVLGSDRSWEEFALAESDSVVFRFDVGSAEEQASAGTKHD